MALNSRSSVLPFLPPRHVMSIQKLISHATAYSPRENSYHVQLEYTSKICMGSRQKNSNLLRERERKGKEEEGNWLSSLMA